MATMSRFEAAFCRSAPWRFASPRSVPPWGLQDARTVTDFDAEMVTAAEQRLAPLADRTTTRQADATALPFDDDSFDMVLSWIMLRLAELRETLSDLPVTQAILTTTPGRFAVRFTLRK